MTSTVSYRFNTFPSSSTIGTADIPCSENMCTTSNTVVCIVAVKIGWKGLCEEPLVFSPSPFEVGGEEM